MMDPMREEAVRLGWIAPHECRQPDDMPDTYYPLMPAPDEDTPAIAPDQDGPAMAQVVNAHRPVRSQEQWDAVVEDFVEGAAEKHGSYGQLFGEDEDEDW